MYWGNKRQEKQALTLLLLHLLIQISQFNFVTMKCFISNNISQLNTI